MNKKIIWSYAKGEFVVFDHYYFSILYQYLKSNYILEIPTNFNKLIKLAKNDFDVIVFNYPEKFFTKNQQEAIHQLFEQGKKIIFLTYYKNEDKSSQIANEILEKYGLFINYDEVTQNQNVHNNDKYLITTEKIDKDLKKGVSKIILPCCSSVKVNEKQNYKYKILVRSEEDSKVLAAEVIGNGKIMAFGTCVFWDNFSIQMYDNFNFVKNLFRYLEH
ncbi:MAG: hypothetical protein ACK4GR_00820 [bacterium]